MKKAILFITLAIAFCFTAKLQAEENKPLTLIIIKNDSVNPDNGESYHKQSALAYFHNGDWLGGGLTITAKPKFNYTEVKPFLTINKGPYYLLGGVSTDSNGADYFQGGIWYINKFNKIEVFLDISNYAGIGGKTTDYLEIFLEVEYPISEKYYAGLDLDYIRYLRGGNHNYYFIGPYVGYKVSSSTSIFLRLSRDWDAVNGNSNSTNCVRTGLEIMF